jgi:hypothetical protein
MNMALETPDWWLRSGYVDRVPGIAGSRDGAWVVSYSSAASPIGVHDALVDQLLAIVALPQADLDPDRTRHLPELLSLAARCAREAGRELVLLLDVPLPEALAVDDIKVIVADRPLDVAPYRKDRAAGVGL